MTIADEVTALQQQEGTKSEKKTVVKVPLMLANLDAADAQRYEIALKTGREFVEKLAQVKHLEAAYPQEIIRTILREARKAIRKDNKEVRLAKKRERLLAQLAEIDQELAT